MKEFVLRKELPGTLTISDLIQDEKFAIGFITPNGDGEQLVKFLNKLKDGDCIKIGAYKK